MNILKTFYYTCKVSRNNIMRESTEGQNTKTKINHKTKCLLTITWKLFEIKDAIIKKHITIKWLTRKYKSFILESKSNVQCYKLLFRIPHRIFLIFTVYNFKRYFACMVFIECINCFLHCQRKIGTKKMLFHSQRLKEINPNRLA